MLPNNKNSESRLVSLAAAGDSVAVENLVTLHRDRLKRMVQARMDQRLARCMEASDVVQEVNVEIAKRLNEYLDNPEVPFFVWVRFLARQKMSELVRRNVATQARDVRREVRVRRNVSDSSIALSGYFCGQVSSPSSILRKEELRELLIKLIETLPETDREVLMLRHVEQLTNLEAAVELEISENTCRQRYLRSLRKMKSLLEKSGIEWGEQI